MNELNPIGLDGIDFVEFSPSEPEKLHQLFLDFGFSRTMRHRSKKIDLYVQNDITFFLNRDPNSFGGEFTTLHGPCISSMGWRVENGKLALDTACERGAEAAFMTDYSGCSNTFLPAIYGIGESVIYFVQGASADRYSKMGFEPLVNPDRVMSKGFLSIDHLTNNVETGTMQKWADFYKDIFGFTEVRYFDIRGVQTGLTSYALKSPCGKFCIPINEAKEDKSQINEYLREYHGPGIQHLAFLTDDILASLDLLHGSSIETLDIDPDYYEEAFQRVKQVTEDKSRIQAHKVLVDGDENGYLLQIFTRNLVGPIFIEIIQRKNHYSFGEGNFKALFRSIERDQAKRGVFA